MSDNTNNSMLTLSILWRNKLTILMVIILTVFLTAIYLFFIAKPLYPAKTVVALEASEQSIVDFGNILSNAVAGSETVNTEVEVIRSRNLIEKLAKDLKLIEDPEFNPYLEGTSIIGSVMGILGISTNEPTEEEVFNEVIDNLLSVVSVYNIRKSYVFTINVITEDKNKSALIANTLSEIYIQDSLDKKLNDSLKASKWLSKKVAELKVELETSEFKVKEFSDGTQLISEESLSALSVQIKEMRDRIKDISNNKEKLLATISKLDITMQAEDYGQVIALARDTKLSVLGAKNLNEAANKASFDSQFTIIKNRLKLALTRHEKQLISLLTSEDTLKQEITSQSADLLELQQLQRDSEANSLLYESFLSRLKETTIQQGLQAADSRQLSTAVPRPATSPKKGLLLILATIFGAFMGGAFVLIREARLSNFRTLTQLEEFVQYKVFGTVPIALKKAERLDILKYAKLKPTSVYAEAIRNLRTSLLMSNIDNPPKVIEMTSSVPGEGKTTLTLSLAQNFVGLGKKVLVIEGDVRLCIFKDLFNFEHSRGLVSVMTGKVKLKDAVMRPDGVEFDILRGERSAANAADLFASNKFAKLIQEARDIYDYILIDTAPVLAVPDARIIAQHSDIIVYSVLWNSTSKLQVKHGLDMFKSVGLDVSGLVLNNVNQKEMRRYGYRGQYGYDNHYGDNSYYEE